LKRGHTAPQSARGSDQAGNSHKFARLITLLRLQRQAPETEQLSVMGAARKYNTFLIIRPGTLTLGLWNTNQIWSMP
jgi:hypothetical protein